MPRRSKGPRLYLRKNRVDRRTGQAIPDIWFIRDGACELSTGCGADQLHGPDGAEQALARHIAAKWSAGAAEPDDGPERRSDPARVLIAEVLTLYVREKAPKLARPADTASRVKILLGFPGWTYVADVKRSTCEDYVAARCAETIRSFKDDTAGARRVTDQGARRELEDLSAAIGYWDDEHHLTRRPKVVLPAKPESPRDALTRAQAARLLMAARGYRWTDGRWVRLRDSGPANRAHLRRFIRIGLYSGSRPGVTPKLLWSESPKQAWVDVDSGVVWRRGKREKDHKTKRRPMVKLTPRLKGCMIRWKATDEALMARRAKAELPVTNAVIHHGGRPIVTRLRRAFAACVRDAGLPPEITPHWLRHTAATWLMQNGCDPWDAAGYLGMTVKTLIDNYGHHHPDHQAAALKAMGGRR